MFLCMLSDFLEFYLPSLFQLLTVLLSKVGLHPSTITPRRTAPPPNSKGLSRTDKKRWDHEALAKLKSIDDSKHITYTYLSTAFLQRHGLNQTTPVQNNPKKSSVTFELVKGPPKPLPKQSRIVESIRSKSTFAGRIWGAYPNDALPIEEAGNKDGVVRLARRYGYGSWDRDVQPAPRRSNPPAERLRRKRSDRGLTAPMERTRRVYARTEHKRAVRPMDRIKRLYEEE